MKLLFTYNAVNVFIKQNNMNNDETLGNVFDSLYF